LKCSEFLTNKEIIVKNNQQALVEIRDLYRELKLRARQNVLFECGYFIGLLGREKVAIICSSSIEIPTDLLGLCYLQIDCDGAWKQYLAKEINASGIKIDEKYL
jgi:predicted nucleotide-binding protein